MIARVLSLINPSCIQKCFVNWVKDIAKQIDADVIAIDGKLTQWVNTNPSVSCCFEINNHKSEPVN